MGVFKKLTTIILSLSLITATSFGQEQPDLTNQETLNQALAELGRLELALDDAKFDAGVTTVLVVGSAVATLLATVYVGGTLFKTIKNNGPIKDFVNIVTGLVVAGGAGSGYYFSQNYKAVPIKFKDVDRLKEQVAKAKRVARAVQNAMKELE